MRPHLKKGSREAKEYMARLRGMTGKKKNPPMLVIGNPGRKRSIKVASPDDPRWLLKGKKKLGAAAKSGIQLHVDNQHAGTSDAEIEAGVRDVGARSGAPAWYIEKAVKVALKRHARNRALYAKVMGGGINPYVAVDAPTGRISSIERGRKKGAGARMYEWASEVSGYMGRPQDVHWRRKIPKHLKVGMTLPENPVSGPADEQAVGELWEFIQSRHPLEEQQFIPIIQNLVRKKAAGKYDREKSIKLWMYYVDNAARLYESGGGLWPTPGMGIPAYFNKNTRLVVARFLADNFEKGWAEGRWSEYIPKKYRGKNPAFLDAVIEGVAFGVGAGVTERMLHPAVYGRGKNPRRSKKELAKIRKETGLSMVYLPANQAWALLWGDHHILGIYNSKADAEYEFERLLKKDNPEAFAFDAKGEQKRVHTSKMYPGLGVSPSPGSHRVEIEGWQYGVPLGKMVATHGWVHDVPTGEHRSFGYERPGNPRRAPKASDVEVHTWFERDRSHVEIRHKKTEKTIAEWWDEDVQSLVEDGFLDPRRLEASAIEYAQHLGLVRGNNPKKGYTKRSPYAICTATLGAKAQRTKKWERCVKDVKKSLGFNPCGTGKRKANPGLPSYISNDPKFKAALKQYRARHGTGPIEIRKVQVPKGYPKFLVPYGQAPHAVYDAPKHSNKGKRIHHFGKRRGSRKTMPWLVTSPERGEKFLAYVGGTFKAKPDWLYY